MIGHVRTAGRIACTSALNVGATLGFLVLVTVVAGLAFGIRPIVITSGSMEPTIATGALVLARSVPAADVEVGDVVTVPTATGTRVTHRVVRVDDGGADLAVLTLRGDANPAADPEQYPVSSADRMLLDVPLVGPLSRLQTYLVDRGAAQGCDTPRRVLDKLINGARH